MTTHANIAVCIATYGDRAKWDPLAKRAMASVDRQTMRPCWYSHVHHRTLHEARNLAAAEPYAPDWHRKSVGGAEWLCFLDADDELDPHFIQAMHTATQNLTGDWLLQPATRGVYEDGSEDAQAVLIPPKRLIEGNFLVVSTLIRADQFHRIEGFADLPAYEDWDLWLRATADGARVKTVPTAILRVHVNPSGRNSPPPGLHAETVGRIRRRHRDGHRS